MRPDTLYRDQLVALLPPGKALAAEKNSTLWQLLWGLAGELARVEYRMDQLVTESIMSGTNELITEWEAEFGIPEAGTQLASTLEGRIKVLLAKLVAVGQQDPGYFEDIAEKLGYTIEVEEYQPFFVGYSTVGATVGNLSVLFKWMVWVIIEEGINWNISELIYNIKKNKPAHTDVFFEFKGAGFGRGFGPGFDSIHHYDGSWLLFQFDAGFSEGFANNHDYDGVNFIGGFSNGFSIGFDAAVGGGFNKDGFSDGFKKPA